MVLESLGFSVDRNAHNLADPYLEVIPTRGKRRCEIARVRAAGATEILASARRAEARDVDASPVLLLGLAKTWSVLRQWKHRQSFLEAYGDMVVEVGDAGAIQAFGGVPSAKRPTSLRDFLASPHTRGHVAFSNIPPSPSPGSGFERATAAATALLAAVVPDPSLTGFGDDGNRFVLSAGHDGTGLSPHVHGDTWLTLVGGYKLWLLEPPALASWYPRHQEYSKILARAGRPPHAMLCLQRPGETMFVPAGWGHATLNVGVTLGIGQQEPPGMVRRATYEANRSNPHTLLRATMGATKVAPKLKHLDVILDNDPSNVEALFLKSDAAMRSGISDVSPRERRGICNNAIWRLRRWMRENDAEDELASIALREVVGLCGDVGGDSRSEL